VIGLFFFVLSFQQTCHTIKEKTMKALIVKWQDTNKYVLHLKSNNDLLLERKKQQHEHLHPKIVSWDEWELIERCQ